MSRPMILVAPNGARRRLADHPALPLTTETLVATARDCYAAGADGMHLHIRDDNGQHSLDAGRYRETIDELGSAVPGLRLQITTEAAGRYSPDDQLACLAGVRPDWVSVAVRELAQDPTIAARFYAYALEIGCEVQHILYDASDAARLARWQEDGTVSLAQSAVLHVLGQYDPPRAAMPCDLPDAPATPWMVCAFGPQEHACLRVAASRGADLRVGFENSLTDSMGRPWADNASSLRALCHSLAEVAA